MELIDDEGNLFGVVNVIDALVVLLVLAVAAAGVSLVLSSDGAPAVGDGSGTGDPEPRMYYATIDLGQQPRHVAAQLSIGDRSLSSTSDNLTVTDLFVTPADGDRASVVARVELNGTMAGEPPNTQYYFAGDQLRVGNEFSIRTATYDVTGLITNLSPDGAELATGETPVRLETTVSADVASRIEAGDEVFAAGRTVATIDDVEISPANGTATRNDTTARRVSIGATLRTHREDRRPTFADTEIVVGSTVPVETDEYTIRPRIVRVGDSSLPGEIIETGVTIRMENVRPDIADGVRAGMTEEYGGITHAELTDVRTANATVVVTSDDGNVYRREHPVDQDLTVDATLRTRRTDSGLLFRGERLREGDRITLDLGSVIVRGTVVDTDA